MSLCINTLCGIKVEGAATKPNSLYGWGIGEAWMYRRNAYAKMIDILVARGGPRLQVAKDMHTAVYATEPEATRHLIQIETPPM